MTTSATSECIAFVNMNYPSNPLQDAAAAVFHEALRDYSRRQLLAAAKYHLECCSELHRPTPGKLKNIIQTLGIPR